jgi:hypothetical protein
MLGSALGLVWPATAAAQDEEVEIEETDEVEVEVQTPTAPMAPAVSETLVAADPTDVELPTFAPPPNYLMQEPVTYGEPDRDAELFAQGRGRISVTGGTGSSFDDDYFDIGAGVGYNVADGLELALNWDVWLGGDPTVNRLAPGVNYTFAMIPVVKPYLGAFYRHAFVPDFSDVDYLGGRAGIYLVPPAGRLSISGGAAYERVLDCGDGFRFTDCDSFYPEIAFNLAL